MTADASNEPCVDDDLGYLPYTPFGAPAKACPAKSGAANPDFIGPPRPSVWEDERFIVPIWA